MNLYLHIEIRTRELEGRLLLALAAAERGHRVLLGRIRPAFEKAAAEFPPGVFHDKSLTPHARKLKLLRRLTEAGSVVTSQDEEHWLNLPTYDVPARKRFSTESLGLAARSFAWGPHELDALSAAYPEHAHRLRAVGSPRVDLWRPAYARAHEAMELPGTEGARGFVLFASNFAAALEVSRFWARIRAQRVRGYHVGDEDPYEFLRYDTVADRFRLLSHFVRTVRRFAVANPDRLVVVRPHPIEARGAFTDLIGPLPNVLVTRAGALTPWIRRAGVLVQSDSTSGYEAAVVGTPIVSLMPDGLLSGSVVNGLGRPADSIDDAVALIGEALALDTAGRDAWMPEGGRELLHRRISALDGALATERIVDEWEAVGVEAPPFDVRHVLRLRRRLRARRWAAERRDRLRRARRSGPSSGSAADDAALTPAQRASERNDDPFIGEHKFPPLVARDVEALVAGHRAALGRFEDVEVRLLAEDLLVVAPRGRRGR